MTGRAGPAVIAINATILGERPTGLGVYALGLIRALAARGEDLRVIASQAADLGGSAAIVGAPAATRPERGPLGHLARLIWLQARLPRRISGTGTSVLLNLVPEGPLRCPIPQVTVVHDLIPLFYPAEPPRIPRAHLYFRYVVPILLRASRAVVTVSEATRRDVLARYRLTPERVHVAHPGYDPARFAPGPASEDRAPYLLYVGNVAPHKNLVRLVEAFAGIAPRTRATLVIRGSGSARHVATLRRQIEAMALGDRVDWRPYERASDLPRLYRGARAVVLPSLTEGFGFPALEAMACGTPVIASNAASIPEVVGDAAWLVDPLDTDGLARAMARLLDDDAVAADLRERGLERAKRFSWARTAEIVAAHLRAAMPAA